MKLIGTIKNFFRDEEALRLLNTLVVNTYFVRKEVKDLMSELQTKVEALEAKVTQLEETVTTEIQQIRTILEQNNDVQGAIARLTNLEARIGAVTSTVSEIVSDGEAPEADPLPDAQPPIEAEAVTVPE